MSLGRIDAIVVGADRVGRERGMSPIKSARMASRCSRENTGCHFTWRRRRAPSTWRRKAARTFPSKNAPRRRFAPFGGAVVAPEGVRVFNPAFDVTPARFVDALVTERGVVRLAEGESLGSIPG